MDLFEVTATGHITPKHEAKQVPELAAILTRDKERLQKELNYIWHLCNPKSPYETYNIDRREEIVIADFIKDHKWRPDQQLIALRDRYLEMLDSPAKRLLKACRKATEEITTFLNSESQTTDDRRVELKSKMMEKVAKIIEALDKAEDRVKKEITNEEKIRGGGTASKRER